MVKAPLSAMELRGIGCQGQGRPTREVAIELCSTNNFGLRKLQYPGSSTV